MGDPGVFQKRVGMAKDIALGLLKENYSPDQTAYQVWIKRLETEPREVLEEILIDLGIIVACTTRRRSAKGRIL